MFRTLDIKDLIVNPFRTIGEEWLLITAGTKERCNTMTASWGGLGVLWKKNVATVYIRPQRYTKRFVDEQDCFTLSFFDKKYRKELSFCGSKSGKDVDKIKECNFTVAEATCGAAYMEQAKLVLVCRKLYADHIRPEQFIDRSCDTTCYPQHDYHTFYIGEIVEVLKRD